MVESTALEMRHTGNRIGGSNPSLSATGIIRHHSQPSARTRRDAQFEPLTLPFLSRHIRHPSP